MSFPKDFLWGSATSSYQVEGAVTEGGRTPSIWDTFSRQKGAVLHGATGDIACDQYHRYEEDIQLMKTLGFQAYRFSISWSRILPDGVGKVNKEGVDYYKRLSGELHAQGMKVTATLYHWDLPQVLQDRGGWPNRETAYAFGEYAKTCFEHLGEYVDQWITLNEPWCSSYLGYLYGEHAPGLKDQDLAFKALHHLNLAHGLALKEYRHSGLLAPIGITLNPMMSRPATLSQEDQKAAALHKMMNTDLFLLPLFNHPYPAELHDELGISLPVQKGDMELIGQRCDFLGINYYNEGAVSYDESRPFHYKEVPVWHPVTNMKWPIVPNGLLRILRYFDTVSGSLPLYITENGCASVDIVEDGRIHDLDRCYYIRDHLKVCKQAIDEGVNLKGYYVWSLLDNFEWAFGYEKRFGIIYVDYPTQKRIPKDSAYMMRDIIAGYDDF